MSTLRGGVGGGFIRDIITMQVPSVLRTDFYATASLLGAAVAVVLLRTTRLPARWASLLGIVICFTTRVLAVRFHWHLPRW